jgi:hypothetical protein
VAKTGKELKMEINNRPYKCDVCEEAKAKKDQRHTITIDPIETYDLCDDCAFRLLGNLITLCNGSVLVEIIKHIKKEIKRGRATVECTNQTDQSS